MIIVNKDLTELMTSISNWINDVYFQMKKVEANACESRGNFD